MESRWAAPRIQTDEPGSLAVSLPFRLQDRLALEKLYCIAHGRSARIGHHHMALLLLHQRTDPLGQSSSGVAANRSGGLAIVNPLFTPGLSLEVGPIYLTSFYERAEGAGEKFFEGIGAEPGDVLLLVSTSGRNAFPIEFASSAKKAGLKVIGMTSFAYSKSVESRHPSGKKMYEFCDVVLDNLTTPGDACLEDHRLPQKVGPTSGWVGCLMLQALMVEVAEQMAEEGIVPPIYFALNLDGQEDYVQYLEDLKRERGTKFGGIFSPRRKM